MNQTFLNKNLVLLLTTLVFVGILFFAWSKRETLQNSNPTTTTIAVETSSSALKQALDEAFLDEQKARQTYEHVIAKFGQVRPFINIVQAEAKHISSLEALYAKYNLPIPSIPTIPAPQLSSISEACALGVSAEVENVKLYKEKLLPQVADYADVTNTFESLMSASQNNHLPAFTRCAR